MAKNKKPEVPLYLGFPENALFDVLLSSERMTSTLPVVLYLSDLHPILRCRLTLVTTACETALVILREKKHLSWIFSSYIVR